jgi:hypothetical protein
VGDLSIVPWLRAAAVVCLLEAAAVTVMGVVELASFNSAHAVVSVTTAIFFLLYAVALGLAGRGLANARSWTRAPLVLAQLIQLGLAWSFVGGGTAWIAVLLAVPAVFVTVVLFTPATTEALYGGSSYGGSSGDDSASEDSSRKRAR